MHCCIKCLFSEFGSRFGILRTNIFYFFSLIAYLKNCCFVGVKSGEFHKGQFDLFQLVKYNLEKKIKEQVRSYGA